jgi:uncharacterized membrane protein YcaP (DUF421 family)
MNTIYDLFGVGKDLTSLQMCMRAIVIFFVTLLLIRLSGRRTFGKHSAFDNTMAIILGAVLSRAVVGASPFGPTIACCLLLALLHRGLAWIAVTNKSIERLIKGEPILIYKDGKVDDRELSRSLMSRHDLMGDLRLKGSVKTLEEIEEMRMETTGEVSVIKKKENFKQKENEQPDMKKAG